MPITTIELAGEALKTFYTDALRYQLNERSSPTVSRLERTTDHVEGKEIKLPIRYGRSGGVGNRAEDGSLPEPYPRQTRMLTLTTKNIFARIQLTDKLIEASKSNKGAFADLLTQELKDAEADAKDSVARQYFGDGTGLIGTVSSVTDDTLTLSSVLGLAEGMAIDAYQSTGTLRKANMRVLAVDEDNNTVTVDDATGVVATDEIYIAGNKGLEITGFKAVFEASTLYGVDRNTAPYLNCKRINVNGEISETKIQEAIDAAETRAGAQVNHIAVSYGVRRAYFNLLTAQKRQINTLTLQGGWKALEFNGIPLVAEKYMSAGKMYLLNTEDWKTYQIADWDWMDRDGAILSRVSGKPAYEATLRKYCDLGCSCPRAQVELYGITEH